MKKVLKPEQIVRPQRILNRIQKGRASEASEEKKILITMGGNCLFYPELQAIKCQFRQIIGGAKGYSGPPTQLLGAWPLLLLPPLPMRIRLMYELVCKRGDACDECILQGVQNMMKAAWQLDRKRFYRTL